MCRTLNTVLQHIICFRYYLFMLLIVNEIKENSGFHISCFHILCCYACMMYLCKLKFCRSVSFFTKCFSLKALNTEKFCLRLTSSVWRRFTKSSLRWLVQLISQDYTTESHCLLHSLPPWFEWWIIRVTVLFA